MAKQASILPIVAGLGLLLLAGGGKKSSGGGAGMPAGSGPDRFNPKSNNSEDYLSSELSGQYPQEGVPMNPEIAGDPGDPALQSYLDALDRYLQFEGIDLNVVNAVDLTTMPRAPGDPVAIPPMDLWPNIIPTVKLYLRLRDRLGLPMNVRGYRPPDYNDAVGGSDRSTHQWFSALDIRIDEGANTRDNRYRMGIEAAKLYEDFGIPLDMGFGIYGEDVANVVHIDTLRNRPTTWEDARTWLQRV
jgi:hypothetical protein